MPMGQRANVAKGKCRSTKPRLSQDQLLAIAMVHSQPAVSQLTKTPEQALKRERAAQRPSDAGNIAYACGSQSCIKEATDRQTNKQTNASGKR